MLIKLLKKLPFFRRYSTKNHLNWWKNRKIDWKESYLDTWNHPHRRCITGILRTLHWLSLVEIGCGPAPNLIAILKEFKGVQLGGVDVNPEAIALAKKTFNDGLFKVCSGDDVMLSDKSTDVSLTDMCLIYVGPRKIHKYIEEMKRISRNYVVLCEFHSSNPLRRLWIKLGTGHHAYNYFKLLSKHGFYDIMSYRFTEEDWPDSPKYNNIRHIFVARVPKR